MEKSLLINDDKKLNVSKTALRSLFLLKLLIKRPMSSNEMKKILLKMPIFGSKISNDTILLTINNLIYAGCEIEMPSLKNSMKYSLISHPFKVDFDKDFPKIFNKIRNDLTEIVDLETILSLNNFYKKIADFTESDEVKRFFSNNAPLKGIDFELLSEIKKYLNKGYVLNLEYNSPNEGLENFEIIPEMLKYQDKRLYLWGYSLKHKNESYIRVDKIKKINSVNIKKMEQKPVFLTVKYKINRKIENLLDINDKIKIIDKTPSEIMLEEVVTNEFNFLQKISSYTIDAKILEPQSMVEKYLYLLRSIKGRYF